MKASFTSFLFAMSSLSLCRAGFFNWMFGRRTSEDGGGGSSRHSTDVSVSLPRGAVPFEMKTADDKFLAEAQILNNLSPLDACHHRVVAKIKGTCSAMSEEDLGKMAVLMLNCQSQSEDRPVYPCTTDMTIKDCTKDMDPTTWNAYQIVSNRVRAICYSTRQQQFRLKTEFTVNKLVHTTENHLENMKEIKESQRELNEATTDTLTRMSEGQQELIDRQRVLRDSQEDVQLHVVKNLRELKKEKSLISAGNKLLADMTENIKEKLDVTMEKLAQQESEQKKNHADLMEDLHGVRTKAKEVWDKIDKSSRDVLQFHNETAEQYRVTLENLQKVNSTVTYVVSAIDRLHATLEDKINFITNLIGGTDVNMKIVSTVIMHIGYLLLAAISASFLHTPTFSRVILLLMVPFNAVSEVKQGKSLGFLAMTLFIVLTIFANWIVAWTWYLLYKHHRNKITSQKAIGAPLSPITPNGCASTPIKGESGSPLKLPEGLTTPHVRTLISLLEQMCDQDSKVLSGSPTFSQKMAAPKTEPSSTVKVNPCTPGTKVDESLLNSSLPGTSVSKIDTSLITPDSPSDEDKKASVELVRRHLLNTLETTPSRGSSVSRRSSRPSSRASTPNRSSSRPLCSGITKTGAPCRLTCMEGSNFCYRHKE